MNRLLAILVLTSSVASAAQAPSVGPAAAVPQSGAQASAGNCDPFVRGLAETMHRLRDLWRDPKCGDCLWDLVSPHAKYLHAHRAEWAEFFRHAPEREYRLDEVADDKDGVSYGVPCLNRSRAKGDGFCLQEGERWLKAKIEASARGDGRPADYSIIDKLRGEGMLPSSGPYLIATFELEDDGTPYGMVWVWETGTWRIYCVLPIEYL